MGVTRSLHRRLLRSSAAAILLLLAVWAGWTAQHRFGDPPAAVPVIARAGAPGSGLVSVVPSAFYGIPAATAAQRLQALGLRTQVRSVTAPGGPSGTVIGITPAGEVSPGTMITFYVAIALPAGPGHPLATTHQRLPGRHPLSARVMMFAVSGQRADRRSPRAHHQRHAVRGFVRLGHRCPGPGRLASSCGLGWSRRLRRRGGMVAGLAGSALA